MQALSRRIHYGKFVAEVKFREAPQDYGAAIRAQVITQRHKILSGNVVTFQIGESHHTLLLQTITKDIKLVWEDKRL